MNYSNHPGVAHRGVLMKLNLRIVLIEPFQYVCVSATGWPSGVTTWFAPKWSRVRAPLWQGWAVRHWVRSPTTASSTRLVDTQRISLEAE